MIVLSDVQLVLSSIMVTSSPWIRALAMVNISTSRSAMACCGLVIEIPSSRPDPGAPLLMLLALLGLAVPMARSTKLEYCDLPA